jgi:hypothetical protein
MLLQVIKGIDYLINNFFWFLYFTHAEYSSFLVIAQRLAAQRLGRFRYVVTILAGNLKSQSSLLSLSLGQVSCSGVLGGIF